jgi:DNA polymerase (family 10)
MSINPDAHSIRELDLTHWGVEMARKGGVPKDRVLNCLTREELTSYIEQRRAGRRVKLVPPRHRRSESRTFAAPRRKQVAPRKNTKA